MLVKQMLIMYHLRRTAKLAQQSQANSTGFTVNTSEIITQAQSFFNSFSGVLAVAIGIGLGGSILYKVKNLF